MRRFLAITFLLISLPFIPSSYAEEPTNLATLRLNVKQYYHSGSYLNDAKAVVAKARKFINFQVKRLQNKRHKIAIVLDIDETSLSNYSKMEARDFVADAEAIHREILAGDSPAIEPMLSLYKEAQRQGVAIFFVTGRTESEKLATIKNLKEAGYNKWSGLYMRPEKYSLNSIIPFKAQARRDITNLGYTIIASIGDQESDIKGGYALKGFKLPNPYYYIP